MSRSSVTTALIATAIAALVVITGAAASSARGERALLASDDALAKGDTLGAVLAARAAAEAYAPFSSVARRGFEKLESLAQDADGHGDLATASAARRAHGAAARETGASTPSDLGRGAVVPSWVLVVVTLVSAATAFAAARFVATRRA